MASLSRWALLGGASMPWQLYCKAQFYVLLPLPFPHAYAKRTRMSRTYPETQVVKAGAQELIIRTVVAQLDLSSATYSMSKTKGIERLKFFLILLLQTILFRLSKALRGACVYPHMADGASHLGPAVGKLQGASGGATHGCSMA